MLIIGSSPRDVAENPGSISITTASIAAATRVAVVHVEGDLRFHIGRTFQNIVTITFFGGQEHERANCEGFRSRRAQSRQQKADEKFLFMKT